MSFLIKARVLSFLHYITFNNIYNNCNYYYYYFIIIFFHHILMWFKEGKMHCFLRKTKRVKLRLVIVFKDHNMYFYTLFHPHIFLQNLNNVIRNLLPNEPLILFFYTTWIIMLLVFFSIIVENGLIICGKFVSQKKKNLW